MTSDRFSMEPDTMCVPLPNIDGKDTLLYPGIFIGILYFVCICLYCHIYINVKRTTERTEQFQRDSRVARRIALTMFTNVLFCILPLVVVVVVIFSTFLSGKDKAIFMRTCTVTCLCMNALLNPFLFSFRNEIFCAAFRKLFPIKISNNVDTIS